MVANIWKSENSGSCPLERWQSKIRKLRHLIEDGRQILRGLIKKRKKTLLACLHNLDKKAENDMLTDQEISLKYYLKERLVSLLREEELKWYERAKVKTLLEGDANTRFFHLVAKAKHRKQHIYRLEDDQGVVVSVDHLKSHITTYYKNLFGTPDQTEITLLEDQILDI
jgi:glycyl-tRNA synthetase beta subunit